MTEMVSTGEAEDVTDMAPAATGAGAVVGNKRPRVESAPLGVVAFACGKTMNKESRSRMVLDTGR